MSEPSSERSRNERKSVSVNGGASVAAAVVSCVDDTVDVEGANLSRVLLIWRNSIFWE